ncbi:hypothetical protein PYCCODRAFT_1344237, partial [Trametes coccinea BRFM310]
MIRTAGTRGIEVPGLEEAIRATLFADDTTTYLSEHDNFKLVQNVLDMWCSASRAKFNISKTEIIPIGTKSFREQVVKHYKETGTWNGLPQQAKLAEDGEAIRLLGAYVGNKVNNDHVWEAKIAKVEETLERWSKHHTTISGKRYAIQMVVGGLTQFLADVQSLPKTSIQKLEKAIRKYIWGENRIPPVKMEQLYMPWTSGGLGILDLQARNEAINIMWLRSYLMTDEQRPTWAF